MSAKESKLHPDLLRACASYLVHADAYPNIDVLELLREDARASRPARAARLSPRPGHPARPQPADVANRPTSPLSDEACDELTRAHMDAIRLASRLIQSEFSDVHSRHSRLMMTGSAILGATPLMLNWWAGQL